MDKIKVLIVDDQTLLRDGLRTILELDEEIEVIDTARDGREALKKIEKEKPNVILMDIRMPEMNGVECTRIVKEKYPEIVVLMLTTFDDEEYIVDSLKYEAAGYLLKDIEGSSLVSAVKDAYNGKMLLPSQVAMKLAKSVARGSKEENMNKEFNFSEREREIAVMLSQGFTNKQISSALFISEGTVKNYVSTIYSKIGMGDRTSAAIFLREKLNI